MARSVVRGWPCPRACAPSCRPPRLLVDVLLAGDVVRDIPQVRKVCRAGCRVGPPLIRHDRADARSGEDRLAQDVEPDRAEVERAAVEVFERERIPVAVGDLVTELEPEPLPDLVARRLPRPAEVAVELEAHRLL